MIGVGRLKIHVICCSLRKLWLQTFFLYIYNIDIQHLNSTDEISSSVWSENLNRTPCGDELTECIYEVISSTTSICTALVMRQVNRAAHLFLFDVPPLVRRVIMFHGTNTPTTTVERDGCPDRIWYLGTLEIFWYSGTFLGFLQVTHLWIIEATSLFHPTIQNPDERIHVRPSVK